MKTLRAIQVGLSVLAVAGLADVAGPGAASATVASGNCPTGSGVLSGYYCSYQSSPRTGNNISSNQWVPHHSSYSYLGGTNWNDHNKDNSNGAATSWEICIDASYLGGPQIVLSPFTGQVVSTPRGSSSRPLTNSCMG